MPDPRACAVCGQQILWLENGLGIVALDEKPDLEGRYYIVNGKAYLDDLVNDRAKAALAGPLYRNHVVTCVRPKAS